jgi:hypothetical protein
MQKGRQSNLPPSYFRRNNLSLVGCSTAEPTSFLIEQGKIQRKLLYLQSVKKSDHLQYVKYSSTFKVYVLYESVFTTITMTK